MTISQVHPAGRARRRRAWRMFGLVSTLALAAGVVADLVYGDGSHLVAILVCGLTLVGLAAVLMALAAPDGGSDEDSEHRIGIWG